MSRIDHNRSPDYKSQKERIRELTDELEKGVTAVFESESYKAFIECCAKFHSYEPSPYGRDYNDYLVEIRKRQQERTTRQKNREKFSYQR